MTSANVVDLLKADTKRTLESSKVLANQVRTLAFTVAYERVFDYHPEARKPDDLLEVARGQAVAALLAAAKDLQDDPPSVISSYELI